MGWISRKADVHVCHRPYSIDDAPGARDGDRWECDDCKLVWEVTGFDSGMQWDPIKPAVIRWRMLVPRQGTTSGWGDR